MKQSTQNPGLAVYVAFHINEDVRASGESARILNTVTEIFGDSSGKAHEVATMDSREIVVKLQRPVMDSDSEEKAFFEKLSRLFAVCSIHNPHFTPVSH